MRSVWGRAARVHRQRGFVERPSPGGPARCAVRGPGPLRGARDRQRILGDDRDRGRPRSPRRRSAACRGLGRPGRRRLLVRVPRRLAVRYFWCKLSGLFVLLVISLFLSLAIEPGVNRLARRGWRRGRATALLLFGVLVAVPRCSSSPSARWSARRSPTCCRTPRPTSPTPSIDQRHVRHPTSTPQEVIADFNDPERVGPASSSPTSRTTPCSCR